MSKGDKTYEVKDHQLYSSTRKLWRKLKSENEIAPSQKKKARRISFMIFVFAPFRWLQNAFVRSKLKRMKLADDSPVFVIGHWRSGTTHLHYLLSQDPQFATVGSFQAFFFNIAFTTRFIKPLISRLMPDKRPQDNVKIGVDLPQEDEHAFVNVTHMSGMHIFFFPKNHSYFDKYNCFDGVTDEDLDQWKEHYQDTLKEIQLFNRNNKRLLLKNPHNTGRLKVLAELYPNAKFVYIHRNPYDVFNSTRTLYKKAVRSQFLQDATDTEVDELILHCYQKMLETYEKQKLELPSDRLVEVGYEALIEDPITEMKRIYDQVSIGDFEAIQPRIEAYLKTVKDYKKNPPKPIESEMLKLLNEKWQVGFNRAGYEKQ